MLPMAVLCLELDLPGTSPASLKLRVSVVVLKIFLAFMAMSSTVCVAARAVKGAATAEQTAVTASIVVR